MNQIDESGQSPAGQGEPASEQDEVSRQAERQFSLKEAAIGVTLLCVILAISSAVGGLGAQEILFFAVCSLSFCLARLGPKRLMIWLAVGACLVAPIALFVQLQIAMMLCGGGFLLYSFAGAPLEIAAARKIRLRRWVISEFGILTVSVAFTPSDIISTLAVFVPLQLAVLLYALVAKD